MLKNVLLVVAAVAVTGCVAIKIPADNLERNEASIRGAEEVGAEGVADAKLHLQMARDQTVRAKRMAEGGNDRAVLMLARAESDADLALALAREATVHAEAVRAADDLRAVKVRGIE